MRLFIIRFFILLGLFFPALASIVDVSYPGNYSGTFSGDDSGTWTATISSTGAITGKGVSSQDGLFTAVGQGLPNGSLSMATTGSVSTGATFIGSINLSTGTISGTWANTIYNYRGTWAGTVTPISNDNVFAYAEANYPSLFPGTATDNQYLQYSYRYYPGSGNYLGIDTEGVIYILGPYTNDVLTAIGPVSIFATAIRAWEATQ